VGKGEIEWQKSKRLVIVLAIGLMALLLVAACAPTAEEEKVVQLGFIAGLTGPIAAPSQYGFRTLEDYTKYFNEAEGIYGVTIKLSWADTNYQFA
jgi:hypothetical protein